MTVTDETQDVPGADEVSPLAGEPVERPSVTGRPADKAPENSTFASRAKAAARGVKAVSEDAAEDKAVKSARRKSK